MILVIVNDSSILFEHESKYSMNSCYGNEKIPGILT